MQPEIVTRGLALRSVDENKRSVDVVASTDAIDSYDEVVEQDWDLTRFLANPVILFGHNSRELPIGKATRCEVVSVNGRKQLECTIQFLSEKANPRAEQVWQSVLEGALRAVSVGFRPGDARFEKRNGAEVFVLSKCELHELSVVPIPANPEALAKMKAKALAAAGNDNQPAPAAVTETIMSEKDLEARIAKAEAAKDLVEKQLDEERKQHAATRTALEASEGTVKALTADRDEWKGRAEKAETAGIETEVDKLVGVKITPAEKATFVELRKTNPGLFSKMVADRPELKLLKGTVVTDDKSTPPEVLANDAGNGAGLATKIFGA